MMNRSGSAETYFPPMASYSAAAMEATSPKHYLNDWETANAALPPVATAIAFPFDCSPPLPLPMNNHHLAFYPHPPPLLPEYLIKREDGIGLNLGQRTYFSSGDGGALEVDRLLGSARSRAGGGGGGGLYSHHQPPRCQAESCKADLSGAKHYHRRHKVCEFHSKATVVVAHGLQQRFCQQCSRFHVLAEFDEAKRSCRKRLADHNRRRRKPQLLMPSASTKSTDQSSSSINKHQVQEQPTGEITSSKPTMAAPAGLLSLGGAEERGGGVHHSQVNLGGELMDDRLVAASNISESSSGFIFHHCNTLSSDSNEGTPSSGGGHSHSHIHTRSHSHIHHQQTNLLHLGQSMFELDFM